MLENFPIPDVIGHRGAAGYAPENTLASFNKALSLGCRFIEFDVMLSADGEAFVFHDNALRRTTDGKSDMGLVAGDYIQSLDAGGWFSRKYRGEKVPTLREAIKWLAFTDTQANIEIKPYPRCEEQTTTAVLTHINRFWPQNKRLPLISSFSLTALRLCRSLSPEMPLGLLLDTWRDDWCSLMQELDCLSLHINRKALTALRAQAIKAQGYTLCVYTVNRKRQATKLFAWGVDAIFSDYPDLLHHD